MSSSINKKELLNELLKNQLKQIIPYFKLTYKDFTRIIKNISTSIFDPNKCCIWDGYITNSQTTKSPYVNFYFKDKKVALHRILYHNFIGVINDGEYLKFTCNNRGKCCNIHHFIKYNNTNKIRQNSESKSENLTESESEKELDIEPQTKINFKIDLN